MTDAEREYLISYLIGYLLDRRLEARNGYRQKNAVIRSPSCRHHAFYRGVRRRVGCGESVKFCLAISKATYTLCFNATSMRQNSAGCEINGAWAALAKMYDSL